MQTHVRPEDVDFPRLLWFHMWRGVRMLDANSRSSPALAEPGAGAKPFRPSEARWEAANWLWAAGKSRGRCSLRLHSSEPAVTSASSVLSSSSFSSPPFLSLLSLYPLFSSLSSTPPSFLYSSYASLPFPPLLLSSSPPLLSSCSPYFSPPDERRWVSASGSRDGPGVALILRFCLAQRHGGSKTYIHRHMYLVLIWISIHCESGDEK